MVSLLLTLNPSRSCNHKNTIPSNFRKFRGLYCMFVNCEISILEKSSAKEKYIQPDDQ